MDEDEGGVYGEFVRGSGIGVYGGKGRDEGMMQGGKEGEERTEGSLSLRVLCVSMCACVSVSTLLLYCFLLFLLTKYVLYLRSRLYVRQV